MCLLAALCNVIHLLFFYFFFADGHVFWDADIWVFPTLNLFFPRLADSHLRFRQSGLAGAHAKAMYYKQAGIMFPWEATPAGHMAKPGGDEFAEPHVTGDVALAFWNRYRATANMTFLRQSFPILEGVADFWAGRVNCSSTRCRLLCLTGPDEFNSCKNDEAYTTALAQTVLTIALDATTILHETPPNVSLWQSVAARLSVNLMQPPGEGPSSPMVTQCYANYSGEAVMQPAVADVGYPLMWRVNATQREIDLDYYWRRTSGFIAGMVINAISCLLMLFHLHPCFGDLLLYFWL